MPHSSGGGSHSGGSHHSSHSGSGSGGHSSHPVYDHYVPGTNRYVYYKNKRPHYYYSDRVYRNTNNANIPFMIFFMVFWATVSIPFYLNIVHIPKKVVTDYNTSIVIEDTIDVLTSAEEDDLYRKFTEFQEKSGVTPALVTVSNSEWQGYYNDLERYAYDRYVNLFPDEKHWLIVYSTDDGSSIYNAGNEIGKGVKRTGNTSFEGWYFEGMQGDLTDNILTSDLTNEFDDRVTRNLTARSRYTVGEAFSEGFTYINANCMKTTFHLEILLFMLIHSGMGIGIPLFLIMQTLKTKYDPDTILKEQATLCPSATDTLMEDTCEYCGGVYIHGLHTSCPHCGAPIKAKYTGQPTDTSSNIENSSSGPGYKLN